MADATGCALRSHVGDRGGDCAGGRPPNEAAGDCRGEALLRQLRVEEKVALLTGRGMWSAGGVPRLGLPPLRLTDGPHGARGCTLRGTDGAALAPCELALAATFDEALIADVGELLGEECVRRSAHVLLGPCLNIQRSPLFGRHFECFSEDPFLSARAAVAYIRGVQKHVAACAKHFVGNDQENFRHSLNTVVDERALREIYLAPFEAAVVEGGVEMVMCGYNRINGRFCTENPWLLTKVLREEWRFQGVTVSDWFGNRATVASLEAGLNIEMPGIEPRFFGGHLLEAVRQGQVSEELLDERCRPVLALTLRRATGPPREPEPDREVEAARRKLLRRAAAASIVLLKNEGDVLPLGHSTLRRVAVLGPNAAETVAQGGGSARVRPKRCATFLEVMREVMPAGVEVLHAPGCLRGDRAHDAELEALKLMGACDATGQPSGPGGVLSGAADFALRVAAALSGSEWCRRRATSLQQQLGWRRADPERVGVQTHGPEPRNGLPTPPGRRPSPPGVVALALAVASLGGLVASDTARHCACGAAVAAVVGFGVAQLLRLARDRREARLLASAEQAAAEADVCLLFLGTHGFWESEGADQPHMGLPGRQDELAQRVAAAARGPVVVVLNVGSPKTLPWLDRVPALVLAHFGGEEMAAAVVGALLGTSNPAGRLPTTWPRRLADTPAAVAAAAATPVQSGDVQYGEGLAVGYRGFPTGSPTVLFPFGYGLSYTHFTYGQLAAQLLTRCGDHGGPRAMARLQIRNAGNRAGAEVVQLYVEVGGVARVLGGFSRTAVLEPSEAAEVVIELGPRELGARYDASNGAWQTPAVGTIVTLHVGASLFDFRTTATLLLD